MEKTNKHIILIGFMGTGKSTVGARLAEVLSLPFIDTDQQLELKEHLTIPEIFQEKGEEYFRLLESEVLKEVTQRQQPLVISTGGGIILARSNREILAGCNTVLLEASVEELYTRVKNNADRPLLSADKDLLVRIRELLASREDLYKSVAKLIIDTNNKEIADIIEEIVGGFSL